MDYLPVVLAFGTLGFVAAFGYLSARATDKLRESKSHKPSSLAADSPEWTVAR